MERTLIILKPDSVMRGIVGEVVSRFEKVGLKIVGVKMLHPDRDQFYHHYETISKMISRRGQQIFDVTLDRMQEGPVIFLVLEGVEAVSLVRKMVGTTNPKEAPAGTIRGDYTHVSLDYADKQGISIPNVIHASGDLKEAKEEIAHWFSQSELFDYKVVHEVYTQPVGTKKK